MASVRVLERAGCNVSYEPEQTCCGQPFLNMGEASAAAKLAEKHLRLFEGHETIVCPSGSCVATVRNRYTELEIGLEEPARTQRQNTFELGEFLVRELGTTSLGSRFEHRVAVLPSCHGLRDLGLGSPSELPGLSEPAPINELLDAVDGLIRVPSERDECCGFGWSFAVKFPEISARMGRARLQEWADAGAEYVTSTDVSCLLHLEGLRRREGFGPRPIHLAELLATGDDA